jgi:hypothetical protein
MTDTPIYAEITRLAQLLHDDPDAKSQFIKKGFKPANWGMWKPPSIAFGQGASSRLNSRMAMNALNINKKDLLDTISKWKGRFPSESKEFDRAVVKCYEVIWWKRQMALFDPKVLMPPPPRRGPPLDPDVAGAACLLLHVASGPTPPVATALAPAPAPLVSGVPGILLLADRLRTNEGNIRDSPDVQFELRQTVFSVRWEHPDAQVDRVQAMDQATLETKIRLYTKRAEGHQQNYRQAIKDLASVVPARLPRLHIQAAIALYAQRWAEDCLANMLAVLNSRQASAAESTAADDEMVEEPAAGSTAADDEMVEEPAEGGAAMETDSTSGGLRPIPRAFADDDTFADEDTLRAILTGYADHDTVTALLDNTLDQELAGVLWALYYDQYEGYSSGSPLES